MRPVACLHPEIDPTTQGGLVRAVSAYVGALELCNSMNGYPTKESP